MGRTYCFWHSETIFVHNMFSPGFGLEFSCIELVIQWTICCHIVCWFMQKYELLTMIYLPVLPKIWIKQYLIQAKKQSAGFKLALRFLFFLLFHFENKICKVQKATKFCEIFTLLLSTVHTDKSKVDISQKFVAFSEYMNFTKGTLEACPIWFKPKICVVCMSKQKLMKIA